MQSHASRPASNCLACNVVRHVAAGYALSAVRNAGAAFDLGQVFIGAEGTLGETYYIAICR